MLTVFPVNFNAFIMNFSTFGAKNLIDSYLPCYWGYVDYSMFVILRICCFIQRMSSSFCIVIRVPGQIQCIHHEFFNFRDQKSNPTYLPCYRGYVDYSMFVVLRICSLIQRTSSGLRYVIRVPRQIQCICTAISNFQDHNSSRTYLPCCWGYVEYSMFVILRIWSFIQRTSSSFCYVNRFPRQIQCIHHEFFNSRDQKSNRTYLLCYWGYVVYSMIVILRNCCFIQGTSSSFCYVNRVPCQIQCIHHEFFNFRGQKFNRTHLPCYWGYVDYSMFVILPICCFIQRTSSGLRYVNRVPCQIQCIHHEIFNFRGQKPNRTYLPCYWGYLDYSMFVILRIYCFIQRTLSA
jgi:branched-subunit amino acid transport protein AzlD